MMISGFSELSGLAIQWAGGGGITERTESSDHTGRGFSDLKVFSGVSGSADAQIDALVYKLTGEEEIRIIEGRHTRMRR